MQVKNSVQHHLQDYRKPDINEKMEKSSDETLEDTVKRGKSVEKLLNRTHIVNIPMLEEDLGIYDDVGDCDGLSDTELIAAEGEDKVKTPTKELTQSEKQRLAPPSILRKSSQVTNGSNTHDVKSSYRASTYTALTQSEIDDQGSTITWSAHTKQPIDVYISTRLRSGTRGKPNTPASRLASRMTNPSAESRNASRVASESREAMFRRAMALLSARCTSVLGSQTVETPFGTVKQPTFGIQVPQYFYIKQEKPRPMPPLKAWQGYNGNVYFEPISIAGVPNDVLMPKSGRSRTSPSNDKMVTAQKRPMTEPDHSEGSVSRTVSRNTGKSNNSKTRPSTRQMALLDKRAVLNRFNTSLDEDLTWIETTETTGSLAVRPKSDNIVDYKARHDQMYNRERICKGSVAHKQYIAKLKGQKPSLKVNGGKYSSPQVTSPLLRTQTQYSLSNNRLTTNSPDPHVAQLPPLEQLRSAVRRMDNADKQSYGRQRPLTDDLKPFIKYSPDIKGKQPAVNYV